jgi:hypothetical protein
MHKGKVVCLCDMCKKDKPREFSYFTERTWYCDDCRPIVERNKSSHLNKVRNEFYERFET